MSKLDRGEIKVKSAYSTNPGASLSPLATNESALLVLRVFTRTFTMGWGLVEPAFGKSDASALGIGVWDVEGS